MQNICVGSLIKCTNVPFIKKKFIGKIIYITQSNYLVQVLHYDPIDRLFFHHKKYQIPVRKASAQKLMVTRLV
ncbi:hypothetical protein EFL77_09250 [Pediococcus pentosaceus]|nr:hypothetical protein [Pediococcus pentosaceus]